MTKKPSLIQIQYQILDVLKKHPEGISINDIRLELGLAPDEQQHLDRRLRGLYPYYEIRGKREGRKYLYVLIGTKEDYFDDEAIDKTTRARILHRDGSRCQMCGRTVEEDKVKLHIDHRIPRDWGGITEDENLWALCSECNEGKRNFFATIIDPGVKQAMKHDDIWIRLGELMKAKEGQFIPKSLFQIVAYTHDDWEKRLRELRLLGWKYDYRRHKEKDRINVEFRLLEWHPWPKDPGREIRRIEREKRRAKKRKRS